MKTGISLTKRIINVNDFIDWIAQFGDDICIVHNNVQYSYKQFIQDVSKINNYLSRNSYQKGEYIGLFIESNTYEYLV
jgi:acyl-coenzyme A synthetase/AMP-(fatty) acid ligase